MKRSLIILLALCFSFHLEGQIEIYKATISNRDVYPYTLIHSNGQIEVFSSEDGKRLIIEDGQLYEYAQGEGRTKDQFGLREKHSQYLINAQQERLLTYHRKSEKIYFPDNTWMHVTKTEETWVFEDAKGKLVAYLDLYTEPYTWEMELTTLQQGKNVDTLIRFLAIAIPLWAYQDQMRQPFIGSPLDRVLEVVLDRIAH